MKTSLGTILLLSTALLIGPAIAGKSGNNPGQGGAGGGAPGGGGAGGGGPGGGGSTNPGGGGGGSTNPGGGGGGSTNPGGGGGGGAPGGGACTGQVTLYVGLESVTLHDDSDLLKGELFWSYQVNGQKRRFPEEGVAKFKTAKTPYAIGQLVTLTLGCTDKVRLKSQGTEDDLVKDDPLGSASVEIPVTEVLKKKTHKLGANRYSLAFHFSSDRDSAQSWQTQQSQARSKQKSSGAVVYKK